MLRYFWQMTYMGLYFMRSRLCGPAPLIFR